MSSKVLVLDLDDTLYRERDFAVSGLRAAAETLRGYIDPSSFFEVAKRLFDAGVRGDVFDRSLRVLGLDAGRTQVDALVAAYRAHTPAIELFEDATWLLSWASSRMRLALLTDGFSQVQRTKVAALGVESLFETIVYSDEFGREFWKPSPAPFQEIARRIPAGPRDYAYVGDNPAKDFLAPNEMGWYTIRVRRAGAEHAAVECDGQRRARTEIGSLRKVPAVLRETGWPIE